MSLLPLNNSRRGVVAVTNLFPNEVEPRRGLFNLRQFIGLAKLLPLTIVAPVAYFPLVGPLGRFSSSGRASRVPPRARVEGLEVRYPRYFYPPVVGRVAQGRLYQHGVRRAVVQAVNDVSAMTLFGTWAYPDGFAVTKIAEQLGLPSVIKVHGSDINEYMETRWRRRAIVSTLNRASKVIAVSEALKMRMIECGVAEESIVVIYNGIDRKMFNIKDKDAARARLSLDGAGKRILFVGNLKPVKDVSNLIEAMREMAEKRASVSLHIIGSGPLEHTLKQEARAMALQDSIHFEGEKDPKEIAVWMNACDLLCLPSLHEGVPNVILEALACGLPVVATRVGGIPEVVPCEDAGLLVESRDSAALCEGITRAIERDWVRVNVSKHAERYSWGTNAEMVYSTLQSVV